MSDIGWLLAGAVFGLLYFDELWRLGEHLGRAVGRAICRGLLGDTRPMDR